MTLPKRKYDDEKLRGEALKLRGEGLSYREIAKRLNCSVYKVYELISEHESPAVRLRRLRKLVNAVDELESRVRALDREASRLQSIVSASEISELKRVIEEQRSRLSTLERKVLEISARVEPPLALIELSASWRQWGTYACGHIDESGYCTYWWWTSRPEGLEVREAIHKDGMKAYMINVRKHPLVCVACPVYRLRQHGVGL